MISKKLILGTVQFGLDYGINNSHGKVNKETAFQILDQAATEGVCMIDTAMGYGDAEAILGMYFESRSDHPFRVITKLDHGAIVTGVKSVFDSLERLRIEKLDTLLFHSYSFYQQAIRSGLVKELETLQGQCFEQLGVSVYTNEELTLLKEDTLIKVVQSPFNLLDNNNLRGEILNEISLAGKTVHTRSVFLQGLFFMNPLKIPDRISGLSNDLQHLKALCDEHHVSMGELALQYTLSKTYINGVLFGVDSLSQIEQNLNWLSKPINPEIFDFIDEIYVSRPELLNPSTWHS